MFSFDYVWPYMGLGAALLLATLLSTDILRSDLAKSRWHDLVWLAWLGMLAYLIHQFEEHGIDAEGTAYAFRGNVCRNFGFADLPSCPVPFSYIDAVNVSAVWIFGPVAALLGRRRPELALAFFSVPFVNIFFHLAPAVVQRSYNAGLLSAIVLFLPLSLWAFHVARGPYRMGWRPVVATIAAGVVMNSIIVLSLVAFLAGRIGLVLLDTINVLNPVLVLLIVGWLGRPQPRSK